MTEQESRALNVGDRVCWNGEEREAGIILATDKETVSVEWQDGDCGIFYRTGKRIANLQRLPLPVNSRRTGDPLDAQGDEYEPT